MDLAEVPLQGLLIADLEDVRQVVSMIGLDALVVVAVEEQVAGEGGMSDWIFPPGGGALDAFHLGEIMANPSLLEDARGPVSPVAAWYGGATSGANRPWGLLPARGEQDTFRARRARSALSAPLNPDEGPLAWGEGRFAAPRRAACPRERPAHIPCRKRGAFSFTPMAARGRTYRTTGFRSRPTGINRPALAASAVRDGGRDPLAGPSLLFNM